MMNTLMIKIGQALIWTALILLVALVLAANSGNSAASAGIIAGLTGAAWGSTHSGAACNKGCVI